MIIDIQRYKSQSVKAGSSLKSEPSRPAKSSTASQTLTVFKSNHKNEAVEKAILRAQNRSW